LITAVQLHAALRDQGEGTETLALGELLIRRGWITQDGLNGCLEEQCIAVLARTIRAERGTFLFQPGVTPPTASLTAPLNSNRVLMEATRRVDELAELREQLPPYRAPLSPSAHVDVAGQAYSETETKILKALDAGADSLAELVDLLPMSEYEVLINVIQMKKRGLVVAGIGGHGDQSGVPGELPPGEDDLARLLLRTGANLRARKS
jgi:biotin operon repressor